MVPVVVIPTCFLSFEEVGDEGNAIFAQFNGPSVLTFENLAFPRRVFPSSSCGVLPNYDNLGRERLFNRVDDWPKQRIQTGRAGLHANVVPIAINDEAGQAISFPMNQAVEWLRKEPLPKRDATPQTFSEEGCVDLHECLPAYQPRSDRRLPVVQRHAEHLAIRGLDVDETGRMLRQRFCVAHLPWINPRVATPQAGGRTGIFPQHENRAPVGIVAPWTVARTRRPELAPGRPLSHGPYPMSQGPSKCCPHR
mmetsp:Transcript_849/g.1945  ORF Transcript_849/g.1945 Transcript_849/m.1945 type:complete len:252 (+) Transcript_849:601-1356(+)